MTPCGNKASAVHSFGFLLFGEVVLLTKSIKALTYYILMSKMGLAGQDVLTRKYKLPTLANDNKLSLCTRTTQLCYQKERKTNKFKFYRIWISELSRQISKYVNQLGSVLLAGCRVGREGEPHHTATLDTTLYEEATKTKNVQPQGTALASSRINLNHYKLLLTNVPVHSETFNHSIHLALAYTKNTSQAAVS